MRIATQAQGLGGFALGVVAYVLVFVAEWEPTWLRITLGALVALVALGLMSMAAVNESNESQKKITLTKRTERPKKKHPYTQEACPNKGKFPKGAFANFGVFRLGEGPGRAHCHSCGYEQWEHGGNQLTDALGSTGFVQHP